MKTLRRKIELPWEDIACREGTYAAASDYDLPVIGDEDVDVVSASGKWILSNRIGVLLAAGFLPIFKKVRGDVGGRGNAVYKGAQMDDVRKDGTLSRIKRIPPLASLRGAASVMVGSDGPNGRNPYCRKTSFTRDHAEQVEAMLPFFRLMDEAFQQAAPQFHAAQLALAQRIREWVLRGTSFSGVQVNINWQSALHLDVGNYGPVVMTALTDGWFDGAVLCFPQHRLGVNLRMGNVVIANTQCEWHGNTSLWGVPGEFHRISFVGFLRPILLRCGCVAEEEERRQRFLRTLKR